MEKERNGKGDAEMNVIGENTAEEMAKPPAEREVLVGTKITMSALQLTLLLDGFVEEVFDAMRETADEEGDLHPEFLDVMCLARDRACKEIRETWEREWKEAGHGKED